MSHPPEFDEPGECLGDRVPVHSEFGRELSVVDGLAGVQQIVRDRALHRFEGVITRTAVLEGTAAEVPERHGGATFLIGVDVAVRAPTLQQYVLNASWSTSLCRMPDRCRVISTEGVPSRPNRRRGIAETG